MSMANVNRKWMESMLKKLNDDPSNFDEIVTYPPAKKWLVRHLAESGMMFKVHGLGAGVSRITTNTEVCPYCKRKLP